ncbi:hypothetical protein OMW55_03710 [Sphingomonas sp. BN140010]|uniref:Uncharacterized protein n=1 Tax=Sphingomonas arvum TaxID=2992113 RepID=A0ABT3JCV7_9SPHN|nr:hypothetical protein [Sphingomonas sp. BN140010]MCW3796911.1 hypothetical protein [Sphingomonas sp. BN140010]
MPSYTLRMLLDDEVIGSEIFSAANDCKAIERAIGYTLRHDLELSTTSHIVAERRDGFWSIEPGDHRPCTTPETVHDFWAGQFPVAGRSKVGQPTRAKKTSVITSVQ